MDKRRVKKEQKRKDENRGKEGMKRGKVGGEGKRRKTGKENQKI